MAMSTRSRIQCCWFRI